MIYVLRLAVSCCRAVTPCTWAGAATEDATGQPWVHLNVCQVGLQIY